MYHVKMAPLMLCILLSSSLNAHWFSNFWEKTNDNANFWKATTALVITGWVAHRWVPSFFQLFSRKKTTRQKNYTSNDTSSTVASSSRNTGSTSEQPVISKEELQRYLGSYKQEYVTILCVLQKIEAAIRGIELLHRKAAEGMLAIPQSELTPTNGYPQACIKYLEQNAASRHEELLRAMNTGHKEEIEEESDSDDEKITDQSSAHLLKIIQAQRKHILCLESSADTYNTVLYRELLALSEKLGVELQSTPYTISSTSEYAKLGDIRDKKKHAIPRSRKPVVIKSDSSHSDYSSDNESDYTNDDSDVCEGLTDEESASSMPQSNIGTTLEVVIHT